MKKLLGIVVLGLLLSGCGSSGVSHNSHYREYANWANKIHKQDSRYKYFVSVISKSTLNTMVAASAYSYEAAYETGCDGLKKSGYYDCELYYRGDKQVYVIPTQRTYSSGSTSYGSSYASSQPQLFYDKMTGGMRECAHNALTTGQCFSFKPRLSTYTANTLFYNKSTGSMQPCIGTVTALGQCSMFGLYNPQKVSKGQLFYNPKDNKMTTCAFATLGGVCTHYDLVPSSYAKDTGGFRMTDPNNPYIKRVPRTSQQLIDVGTRMIMGGCTLGIDC